MAPDQTVSSRPAAAALELPSFNSLSSQQVRGYVCVWGGEGLLSGPAVGLGTRTFNRLGTRVDWFPRGCPRCVHEAAIRAIREHTGTCEQCVDNTAACDTRRALEALAEEHKP